MRKAAGGFSVEADFEGFRGWQIRAG
ncbi:MAG: hypothetical protein RL088_2495, partial [Verrucomicrobiota bacterium]